MTEHVESLSQASPSAPHVVPSSSSFALPPMPAREGVGPRIQIQETQSSSSPPFWPDWGLADVSLPPVRWREILLLLSIVVLADVTLFRGTGYAGVAAFVVIVPFALLLASPAPALSANVWIVAALTCLAALRLVWQGSMWVGFAGLMLLIAFAMTVARRTPFVLELIGFALRTWAAGVANVGVYGTWIQTKFKKYPQLFQLTWILPLVAVLTFSGIFIAANPDVATSVQTWLADAFKHVSRWLELFSISPLEIPFCIAVGWYCMGLLRPIKSRGEAAESEPALKQSTEVLTASESPLVALFAPLRNTLVAVSLLFAVYLVFEFQTLWFRKFPQGFHYSGYAHEGAAWLTVALALATVVLSLIFRGALLHDTRLPKLRLWAWIWSAENLILALAVYNRLWIYIGFNGMTRMRTVAILGVSSVLIGFLLVLWKIAHNHGFLWLIRRQLLTVTLAGFVYLILPVDWLVYSYNVHRILAGDPAPVVQITEHKISHEGILTLPPLLNSSDPLIRDGIQSLLEESALIVQYNPIGKPGWTGYQLVDLFLSRKLEPFASAPTDYSSGYDRTTKWARLREYAYQWY